MQRFIGIDVHSASSTVAVVGPSGKRISSTVVKTEAKELVALLKAIKGDKHVCLEEGLQSEWLYEVLSPHAVEVVVANVSGMQRPGNKNDVIDAFGCAESLRLGLIKKRVFKKRGTLGLLRSLVMHYNKTVADHVSLQNRLKALFRARGIAVLNDSYPAAERERLLRALPSHLRPTAEMTLEQFAALSESRMKAETAVRNEAKKHARVKLLCSVPGIAVRRAAQVLAVVVDPNRFASKRKFWSYCGFAVDTAVSGEWDQLDGKWKRVRRPRTRGLTTSFNRSLKNVFNGAAETTIQAANATEPLYRYYQRLIDAGTNPDLARLSLARKIAAICLAVMKSQEAYDPQIVDEANQIAAS